MLSNLDPAQERNRRARRLRLHAAALRAEADRAWLAQVQTRHRCRDLYLLALLHLDDAHRHLDAAHKCADREAD